MPTYLVFHDEGESLQIQEVTWNTPKVIQDYWFGDKAENSKARADVFPYTEAAKAEMEAVVSAYQAAKQAKDLALKARLEACNKKVRGEL